MSTHKWTVNISLPVLRRARFYDGSVFLNLLHAWMHYTNVEINFRSLGLVTHVPKQQWNYSMKRDIHVWGRWAAAPDWRSAPSWWLAFPVTARAPVHWRRYWVVLLWHPTTSQTKHATWNSCEKKRANLSKQCGEQPISPLKVAKDTKTLLHGVKISNCNSSPSSQKLLRKGWFPKSHWARCCGEQAVRHNRKKKQV